MIGTPKEYDTKNKDLEDLEELNPPLPKAIRKEEKKEKKDGMAEMFGQCEHEEEVDEDEEKAKGLSDFIEVIIKIGK